MLLLEFIQNYKTQSASNGFEIRENLISKFCQSYSNPLATTRHNRLCFCESKGFGFFLESLFSSKS